RRADKDGDPGKRSNFRRKRRRNVAEVMGVDPALQKAGRDGKARLPASDRFQFDAPEPAAENVLAQFRAKPVTAASPGLRERGKAGTAEVDGTGIGFVVHVHGRSSDRLVAAATAGELNAYGDRLGLRPGQSCRFPAANDAPVTP